MPVPKDRVQFLKNESPSEGGTEDDFGFPGVANANDDAPSVAGIFIQQPNPSTTRDELVYVTRDSSGNMIFKDAVEESEQTLSQLIAGGGITTTQHKALRQLIHFIDEGPADGFVSGAYKEVTGTMFPTAVVWWESSSKAEKIVERLLTWTGVNLTTDQWKIYDTDGSTLLATVTDTISYAGVFETSRTRAVT